MTILPPRGIRNNNPGNIDFNPRNKWRGQVGIEQGVNKPRFARFDTPENGIRAIAKLLINYHAKGFTSVRDMINRWAPPSENDTRTYADFVADYMDVEGKRPIPEMTFDVLRPMVLAIIKHENGFIPYDMKVVYEGINRAVTK